MIVWLLDVHRSPCFPYMGGWAIHGVYSTRESAFAAAAMLPQGHEGDVDRWRIEGRKVEA